MAITRHNDVWHPLHLAPGKSLSYADRSLVIPFCFNCSAKKAQEQPEVDLKKLGEIARHLIAVKDHEEDMRLDEGEWLLLEKIGYPERFNARKED